MNLRSRPIRSLVFLGAWCALTALPLSAVDPAPAVLPKPAPADEAVKPADPAETGLSFDFSGGTIANLVELLRKNGGRPFNLIGEKVDLEEPLPALSVRNTEPVALANSLNILLEPRGLFIGTSELDRHRLNASSSPNDPIFILSRRYGYVALPTSELVCFDIRPLNPAPGVDAVVSAIETAWRLDPKHRPDGLHVRYHPGTQLLLVSGSSEACAVAKQIVGTLLPSKPAGKTLPPTEPAPAPKP